jgi:hypothetical protein
LDGQLQGDLKRIGNVFILRGVTPTNHALLIPCGHYYYYDLHFVLINDKCSKIILANIAEVSETLSVCIVCIAGLYMDEFTC